MKVAGSYAEAFEFLHEVSGLNGLYDPVGVDIGKQFGTRIVMRMSAQMGRKLLHELQKRDLPLPQVILDEGFPNKVLIGVDPQ